MLRDELTFQEMTYLPVKDLQMSEKKMERLNPWLKQVKLHITRRINRSYRVQCSLLRYRFHSKICLLQSLQNYSIFTGSRFLPRLIPVAEHYTNIYKSLYRCKEVNALRKCPGHRAIGISLGMTKP